MKVLLVGGIEGYWGTSMRLYQERLQQNAASSIQYSVATMPKVQGRSWLGKVHYHVLRRLALREIVKNAVVLYRPDVVHIVDHAYADIAPAIDIPVVVTAHDITPVLMRQGAIGFGQKARIGSFGWNLFERALEGLESANVVHCVSNNTASDLQQYAPQLGPTIKVAHLGVDDCYFQSTCDNGPTDFRTIVHIGNPWVHKNSIFVPKFFAALQSKTSMPLRLRLIGRMPELTASQVNNPSITVVGPVNNQELVEEYARADLSLFPSLYEGFGWPPLEAAASCTPSLVSARGSLLETASMVGAYFLKSVERVHPDDVNFAVDMLENDERRRTWMTEAHEAAFRFRWRNRIPEIQALYKLALA